MGLKIYHGKRTRSLRVVWMLEEMGLDYETSPVELMARQANAEFMSVSPQGTLPAFTDGGVTLTESMAIVEYLGRRYGPTPLIPDAHDPAFGGYLQFLHYGEATLAGPLNYLVRALLSAPDDQKSNWTLEDIKGVFAERIKRVGEALKSSPFVAGEAFTAADISVGYALYFANLLGLADCFPPEVTDYFARLQARPAFRRAAEK